MLVLPAVQACVHRVPLPGRCGGSAVLHRVPARSEDYRVRLGTAQHAPHAAYGGSLLWRDMPVRGSNCSTWWWCSCAGTRHVYCSVMAVQQAFPGVPFSFPRLLTPFVSLLITRTPFFTNLPASSSASGVAVRTGPAGRRCCPSPTPSSRRSSAPRACCSASRCRCSSAQPLTATTRCVGCGRHMSYHA